jgi:squalene-associated FAD-dependent desaturase
MTALRRVDIDDPATDARSFGDWLAEHGQGPETVARIWELITRPTLNLVCEQASLAQAAQVFQVGLLREKAAADVGYARVPLSEIHDVAARRALTAVGVDVRLRRGVTAVTQLGSGFRIEINGAPTVEADSVILAVPPDRAARLLPPAAGLQAERLIRLGRSPIVNLHVVFDRQVLGEPFAAAVDSPVQWIFDRTATSGVSRGQYLAVSLSAAEAELPMSIEELRAIYLPALRELLATDAEVDAFVVTREHAATFRARPGARGLRPGPLTGVPGLLLAGTWTDTGWPATMEGAVRSGHTAAQAALDLAPAGNGHAPIHNGHVDRASRATTEVPAGGAA